MTNKQNLVLLLWNACHKYYINSINELGYDTAILFPIHKKTNNKLTFQGCFLTENNEINYQILDELKEKFIIKRILSFDEYLLPYVPIIGQYLNCEHPDQQVLEILTDKQAMRAKFQEHYPEITPLSFRISEKTELNKIITQNNLKFPLILKPANLTKSIGVSKSFSLLELAKNFEKLQQKIIDFYHHKKQKLKSPKILLEEFLDWPMYSIDSYTNKQGLTIITPIVRVILGTDNNIDDFHNYARILPADEISVDEYQKAVFVVKKWIQAVGLTNSFSHTELMKTKQGWKIVEIGARVGGYRLDMLKKAFGINLFELMFSNELKCTQQNYTIVIEYFADKNGILKKIDGIEELEKLISFEKIKGIKEIGSQVWLSKDWFSYVFILRLLHNDKKQIMTDYDKVKELVKIEVE